MKWFKIFIFTILVIPMQINAQPVAPVPSKPVPSSPVQSPPVKPVPFPVDGSWVQNPLDTPETIGSVPIVAGTPKIIMPPISVQTSSNPAIKPNAVLPVGQSPACGSGNLNDLLSPKCLETLRLSGLETGISKPPLPMMPVPMMASQITCNVSIFPNNVAVASSSTSFQVSDLPRCLEAGSKMNFGIGSLSNIVAIGNNGSVVAVVCARNAETPTMIQCRPQP